MRRPYQLAVHCGFGLAVVCCCWTQPSGASAQKLHTVRTGQTLARIARRYNTTVSNLAAANRLRGKATIRPGQVLEVPEKGIVYVRRGQTLSEIARAHHVSVKQLQRLNRMKTESGLQIGQRLRLPGYKASSSSARRRWGKPKHYGIATFYRPATKQRLRVRLVDRRGRVRRAARRRLANLMRSRITRRRGPIPPARLVRLLANMSDHFGGRTIQLVSGYREARGYTRETSRHVGGRAVDIRIPGVANRHVRDFLRQFDDVGVGYYPRSTFVHVDVRRRNAYWVDWSRPGQKPMYQRAGAPPPVRATRKELALAQMPTGKRSGSTSALSNPEADSEMSDGAARATEASATNSAQGAAAQGAATPEADTGSAESDETEQSSDRSDSDRSDEAEQESGDGEAGEVA